MKKIAVLLALALQIQVASASNYPPDYSHQTVYAIHRGPALFAHVGSGTISGDVIGYKPRGVLARSNPEFIDAIIIVNCNTSAGSASRNYVVRLGREYHGNGYLNDGTLSLQSFGYNTCFGGNISFEFAFSDGRGNWDSNYGRNYPLAFDEFFDRRARVSVFPTGEGSGFGKINLKAWDFIVGQMRR